MFNLSIKKCPMCDKALGTHGKKFLGKVFCSNCYYNLDKYITNKEYDKCLQKA